MADRSASSIITAELQALQNRPAHLFEVYLDSGTIYMTDAPFPITYLGNVYLANGHFLGFDRIEENAQLQVSTTTVTLTGCDAAGPTWVANVLAQNIVDRRIVIRKAMLNAAGSALDAPIVIFDGRISDASIADDPKNGVCSVSVAASSHYADFERVIGRRTNDAIQQVHFSGDKFFEFASEIPGKQVIWGRPS